MLDRPAERVTEPLVAGVGVGYRLLDELRLAAPAVRAKYQ
jgi:hypothetical protein